MYKDIVYNTMISKSKLLNWLMDQHRKASENILDVVDRDGDPEEYAEFKVERFVYSVIFEKVDEGLFDLDLDDLDTPCTDPRTYTDDNAGSQPDVCDTCTHSDEGICNVLGTECKKV